MSTPMTSIKEALEAALPIVKMMVMTDDDPEYAKAERLVIAALASLESGDARERIARIMVRENPNYSIFHMPGEAPRKWKALSGGVYETSPLSEDMAERLRVQADAILATGLVPDERERRE